MIKLQTVENADHVAQAKALFQEYAETRKNDPALEDFHEEIRQSSREICGSGRKP